MSLHDLQHEATSEIGVVVTGSFAPNGSSAVSAASNNGDGWSVARTSTGLFTVTFDPVRANLITAWAWLQLASAANSRVQCGTFTASTGALQIKVLTGALTAGSHAADVYTAAVAASGTVTCVAKANLVDGEIVSIPDGLNAVTVYEFDVAGDGVTAGRVQVNVSTDTTAAQVASRLATAILANQPALVAATGGTAVVTLTHRIPGTIGNGTITEGVTDAGFLVTGMASGAAPSYAAGAFVAPSYSDAVGDIAADANNRINFCAIFGQSSARNP